MRLIVRAQKPFDRFLRWLACCYALSKLKGLPNGRDIGVGTAKGFTDQRRDITYRLNRGLVLKALVRHRQNGRNVAHVHAVSERDALCGSNESSEIVRQLLNAGVKFGKSP